MTMTTTRDVHDHPRIQHDEAMRLATTENASSRRSCAASLSRIGRSPRTAPVGRAGDGCPRRRPAAGQISPREFLRQKRKGKSRDGEIGGQFWWDGMNEVQVRARRSSPSSSSSGIDVLSHGGAALPYALGRLARNHANLKVLNLPIVGKQRVSYLFDVGLTRDVWMHRVDICRAIGYGLDFDAEHDGRLMEDYVAEWAAVYDVPFTLQLTGPAGGSFKYGEGGDTVTIDAVEFLRTLAERAHGEGILSSPLPL
jgi:hypothetical protein